MNEINGHTLSSSVYDKLTIKPETPAPQNTSLGQADFLQLLITQLKNQDPLSPLDNTAFVAQLAQFSSLQGIEDLNSNFVSLNSSLKSSQAIQASALVGHTVFVDSSTARLNSGGEVLGSIAVDKPMSDTLLNIYNSGGLLVHQELLGAQDPGDIRFSWDGRNNDGQAVPPGLYRFEAVGLDQGDPVGLVTTLSANVNSVTIGQNGDMTLNVDGVGPLSISAVKEIL